ncbi:MAG: carboxypeptidase regulatory-like domain-containing protein [Bacteroidetes bacterium]|nr:carboxypeptidase regulatory-like domain-containing protein [Bacteroidota bacterium]
MKQITSFLLFLFLGAGLMAQQGKITGNVTDQVTGKAISEAIVRVGTQQVTSDANGYYEIGGLNYGEQTVTIIAIGFENYETTVTVSATPVKIKAELASKSAAENDRKGITEVNLADLSTEDEGKDQSVSGLLHSSGDVFTSTASYTLGALYFKVRGYDGENFATYMNGINVNDAENGRASWSEWGGLNDATRNKESINGISASRFSFGSLGGSTNIITRASLQRKQTKFTYSFSNKTYTNRAMFTYSTGLMKNGWAFTVSGSRRWGEGGYVKGVFYDAWAYFFSAEKKINNQHSIGFTAYGSPTKRGQQGGSTQEVYDLTGSNYYNPNWGYQNGEVRNAKVKNFHEPMMILTHYWDINEKTKLTSSLAYTFGFNGATALNWYNASDPRPDYYRNLPSYQNYITGQEAGLTAYNINLTTLAWQTDPKKSQIDWDRLYYTNKTLALQGKQSSYIVEDRRNDQQQLSLNILLNSELSSNVKFDGGFEFRKFKGHHFKTMDDLLGGTYWVDIDNFAYRDNGIDAIQIQNDANNPNRIIKVGDVFGYDYDIYSNTGLVWGQVQVTNDKIDYFAAANLNATSFWRNGNMRNGINLNNSFGESTKYNFGDGGIKAGITYKINGRNFITANSQASSRAPSVYNSFVSPRTRNTVTADIKSDKFWTADISYILRTPIFKARLTAYQTMMWDQNEINSFYDDNLATFVNFAMSGINKVHQGIEFGAEIKASSTVSFTAVAAIGSFYYTSNPKVNISYDNGSQPDVTETVYIKNFLINGTPQTAGSIGINYRHPKNWFFNANVNYFGDNYADFNPERRTISAMPYSLPNDPRIPGIINQTKFDDGFTLDASIGKSWQVKKVYVNLNLSVSNVLDNTSLITGGYEQMRFDFDTKSVSEFIPKVYYGFGRTFFLNLGIRF